MWPITKYPVKKTNQSTLRTEIRSMKINLVFYVLKWSKFNGH